MIPEVAWAGRPVYFGRSDFLDDTEPTTATPFTAFPSADLSVDHEGIIVIRLCSLISRPAAWERGTQFD